MMNINSYYRVHSVTKDQPYLVTDDDMMKYSKTEKHFLKWIQDLERKIYGGNNYLKKNGSCDADHKQRMNAFIESYQENKSNILAQDRLAWTVFAKELLKRHKDRHPLHINGFCSTKLCLLLLLWSSYYLQVSIFSRVEDVLRELLICTRSLKCLFSILPGMSMTGFIYYFVCKKFTDNMLSSEFFCTLEEELYYNQSDVSLYQCYSPLLFYFVQKMTPLHYRHKNYKCCLNDFENEKRSPITLLSLLDETFINQQEQTLLTFAVEQKDDKLIKHLLTIGASANVTQLDSQTDDYVTAEQQLITLVNWLVASKFYSINPVLPNDADAHSIAESVDDKIDALMSCGMMMKRSLSRPLCCKAENTWKESTWRHELNSEVADKWGIGYKQPFPSLKHVAKVVIRRQILKADYKLLPDAISELPLPNLLKSYLNLLRD